MKNILDKLNTITPSSQLGISLAEAKDFVKILGDENDTMLTSMIKSATTYASAYTNKILCATTFEFITSNQDFNIPTNPLKEIISIIDENKQELAKNDYELSKNDFISSIKILKKTSQITLQYTAGYVDIPEPIKSWIKVKVATLFEYKEQFISNTNIYSPNFIDEFLNIYRVRNI